MKVVSEMEKLRSLLDEKGILWDDISDTLSENKEYPMWIVRTHFWYKGKRWSAANGFGTYGGWAGANLVESEKKNLGLIELYDFESEPRGWLTADDVMIIIEE